MVDPKLGTWRFIFKFWAGAMKSQRSYCNSLSHFAVSLKFNGASEECICSYTVAES